jgi:hypothetical protein
MFPWITRESAQIVSSFLLISGIAITISGALEVGVICAGVAIWVMQMSESILLTRIQNTMSSSLEALRKKQEIEIEELLYFLRTSKLGNNPWSCLDAAESHIKKIGFPAIITDSGGACVALNPALTESLGYGKEHVGKLCHSWQSSASYGTYVQGIAANIDKGERFMHSRLTMVDALGSEHPGTVAITMLPDMRTAVGIWYPDEKGILKEA